MRWVMVAAAESNNSRRKRLKVSEAEADGKAHATDSTDDQAIEGHKGNYYYLFCL